MPDPSAPADAAVWTDADRAEQAHRIFDRLGDRVHPIAVGGPRLAKVDDLTRRLDCPREDDFRQLLLAHPPRYLLLTTMSGVKQADLMTAITRGALLLTTEPPIASFDQLDQLDQPAKTKKRTAAASPSPASIPTNTTATTKSSAATTLAPDTDTSDRDTAMNDDDTTPAPGRTVWLPAFEQTPGWTAAADPAHVLGTTRQVAFSALGQPSDCSLYARLYDAWRTILTVTTLPDTIDASLAGTLADIPSDPRGITGSLAAHARLPDGVTATVRISDRAGPWRRTVHTVADNGYLRVTDHDYALFDDAGNCLDHLDAANKDPFTFDQLLAANWNRLIEQPNDAPPDRPPPPASHTLACCLASLLSARTGQPESPRNLLQIHTR